MEQRRDGRLLPRTVHNKGRASAGTTGRKDGRQVENLRFLALLDSTDRFSPGDRFVGDGWGKQRHEAVSTMSVSANVDTRRRRRAAGVDRET